MYLTRLSFLVVTGIALLAPALRAQTTASWTPDKQFSADQLITTSTGLTVYSKAYVDAGRIRMDMSAHGKTMTSIVLLYQKKMYTVMEQQKRIAVMPLSDGQVRELQAATGGGNAKFDLMGPDSINGIKCLKYKMTALNYPVFLYWWIKTGTTTPVKIAADDGSIVVTLNNYKPGPQDASLFTPPTNYSVTAMQGGPLRAGVAPIGH